MANMLATNIIYQNKLHWSISEDKFIFLFLSYGQASLQTVTAFSEPAK